MLWLYNRVVFDYKSWVSYDFCLKLNSKYTDLHCLSGISYYK